MSASDERPDALKSAAAPVALETAGEVCRPLITVIVPVFNEAATVAVTLGRVWTEPTEKEIVIVDDGSRDGTDDAIADWIAKLNLQDASNVSRVAWLRHDSNQGKGSSIRTGLSYASGRFVVVQDADLELHPDSYSALMEPLLNGDADIVIGIRTASRTINTMLHRVGVWLLGKLAYYVHGYAIRDAACCYKVVSLKNLRKMQLTAREFDFCPEVIGKAARLKLKLAEVPVAYFPRHMYDGKKLRLVWDGGMAIATLIRARFWKPMMDDGCHESESTEQIATADCVAELNFSPTTEASAE
ncbi:MAG: glycosyltransferase family 2 protein [Planctomycetaceae bacterium]